MKNTKTLLGFAALILLLSIAVFLETDKPSVVNTPLPNNSVKQTKSLREHFVLEKQNKSKQEHVNISDTPIFKNFLLLQENKLEKNTIHNGIRKGRVAEVTQNEAINISSTKEGDTVSFIMFGQAFKGTVNSAFKDELEWSRVGGDLVSIKGNFFISVKEQQMYGIVVLDGHDITYEIYTEDNKIYVIERLFADLSCKNLSTLKAAQVNNNNFVGMASPVPLLNSRPVGANAVFYLDFDGEIVRDPAWNRGRQINALPYNLTSEQIIQIFNRVAEDFMIFNVNITTDVRLYNAALPGKRMRCIITPTDTAAPGAGGVAYLDSFSRSGSLFSTNVPCWVFNSEVIGISEAISHELGHTLGLLHDGRTIPAEEYYSGSGQGDTSWAPIMGVGYDKKLVQWSKGEYLNANNTQDDIAIISSPKNSFGLIPDDYSNSLLNSQNLNVVNNKFIHEGIVNTKDDFDLFKFSTIRGVASTPLTVFAKPNINSPNVDVRLELLNASGNLVFFSDPSLSLKSGMLGSIPPGTYFLKVMGTGKDSPLNGGYSNYGSVGKYTLEGTINIQLQNLIPVITSPLERLGVLNQNLSYQIIATNTPNRYSLSNGSRLPAGLTLNVNSGLISGAPTVTGIFPVQFVASNDVGSSAAVNVTFRLFANNISLPTALNTTNLLFVSLGSSPWTAQTDMSFDRVASAASGRVANNQYSALETIVKGPCDFSFMWKVDCEPTKDKLVLIINERVVDSISGVIDWNKKNYRLGKGNHVVRWLYMKDATVSQGSDRGWVDVIQVKSF